MHENLGFLSILVIDRLETKTNRTVVYSFQSIDKEKNRIE